MKTRCMQLMTTFMAIIGLNAAILVGYILIYSQYVGEFPQTGKNLSSGIITAQAEDSSNILIIDTQNTFPNSTVQPDNMAKTVKNNTSASRTAYSYDPVKQQLFGELQARKEQLSQEQPYFTPAQNAQNNLFSDSDTSDRYASVQDSHNTSASEQNIQESLPPVQNPQEQDTGIWDISGTVSNTTDMPETTSSNNNNTGSPSHSGNSANFNTYNNPHLQMTTDKYVLNTYSQVFHIPDCNDVADMAEKNYATSNNSFGDIVSWGYRPCGHCLKDYPGDFSGYSDSSDYAGNFDISDMPDSTVGSQNSLNSFIINTETMYFHKPDSDCKYLAQTKLQSSRTTTESYEELRSQGYHPCRHCGFENINNS